ncbi:hypothetical protein L1987_56257 [Smallanthus sonchifolius]|uniref:Uncharacterized protein n=1 Tax=Smallanthus sonchifolius TaxID=185202 RepID=A0ACB9EC95_9ASTR|nr:hypothetical protein L1987_56257 [Smallanthus sonchifolius]
MSKIQNLIESVIKVEEFPMDQIKAENLSSDESHGGEKRKSPQQPVKSQSEPKKTKTSKSDVWDDFEKFTDVDGKKKGRCKHCSKALAADPVKNGTSTLKNHVNICPKQPGKLKGPSNLRTIFNCVRENPSSNGVHVHEHPDLSRLKPPSGYGGFRTEKEYLDALKAGSSVLISNIKVAVDANEMIDFSSKAFAFFDSIEVDYTPLYNAVCSVIRHHCDKEALVKQKPQSAFDTKAAHDQAASEFSEAVVRYSGVNNELEDAQHELDAVTAHIDHLNDEIKKAEEEKAALEAKVVGAQADKVTCDEAFSKAKSKLQKIAPEMGEAMMAIDDFRRRWKETMKGLNLAMDELSSLRSSLQ